MSYAKTLFAAFYTGAALFGTPALAEISPDLIEEFRAGDMRKLTAVADGGAVTDFTYQLEDGTEVSFADQNGKVLLVNFWATWCAPCREEMPALNALQNTYGGDDFEVLTIATGRNPMPAIKKFFADEEIDALPILLDPKQSLARSMGARGLPATIIIDRDGSEVARMTGDADWFGNEAKALIEALIAAGPDS